MKAQCPHCKSENEGNAGELRRCDGCNKTYEHGGKLTPQKKVQTKGKKTCPYCIEAVHENASICRYCHSDLRRTAPPPTATEYGNGLTVAQFIKYIGYFVVFLGLLTLIVGFFNSKTLVFSISAAVGLFVSGFSLVLYGMLAKAVMKTADYTRIMASKNK